MANERTDKWKLLQNDTCVFKFFLVSPGRVRISCTKHIKTVLEFLTRSMFLVVHSSLYRTLVPVSINFLRHSRIDGRDGGSLPYLVLGSFAVFCRSDLVFNKSWYILCLLSSSSHFVRASFNSVSFINSVPEMQCDENFDDHWVHQSKSDDDISSVAFVMKFWSCKETLWTACINRSVRSNIERWTRVVFVVSKRVTKNCNLADFSDQPRGNYPGCIPLRVGEISRRENFTRREHALTRPSGGNSCERKDGGGMKGGTCTCAWHCPPRERKQPEISRFESPPGRKLSFLLSFPLADSISIERERIRGLEVIAESIICRGKKFSFCQKFFFSFFLWKSNDETRGKERKESERIEEKKEKKNERSELERNEVKYNNEWYNFCYVNFVKCIFFFFFACTFFPFLD